MSASSSKPWACPSSNAWASAREQHGPGCSSSSAPGMPSRPRTRYPEVELVIVTGNTSDIAKAVTENTLDVGVVTLPVRPRQLVVTPFYTDRLVAIAPREWPWRTRRGRGRPPGRGRRRSLTPADLAAEPLILYERG